MRNIGNEMDLLTEISAKIGCGSHMDIVVLHINHCVSNSFVFNRILKQIFGAVFYVATPYNANRPTAEPGDACSYYALPQDGSYTLFRDDLRLDVTGNSFQQTMQLLIEQAMRRDILPLLQNGMRLLIIEDGGYHYQVLQQMADEYPWLYDRIVGCVEQTVSGTRQCIRWGDAYGYAYPCASISRSDIKIFLENIFIGNRVVEEVNLLMRHSGTCLDFHPVLMLGYGIIGRRCAKFLQGYFCPVQVYDISPEVRSAAAADGMCACSDPAEIDFSLDTVVLAVTGFNSFTRGILGRFLQSGSQRLYLASGSSNTTEFTELLTLLDGNDSFPGLSVSSCVREEFGTVYTVDWLGQTKQLYLLADGYPVNFYREDVISLPNSVIDVIFSEMLCLAGDLCSHDRPKKLFLLGVDEDSDEILDEKVMLRSWFEQHGFIHPGDPLPDLDRHPLTKRLRGGIFRIRG